MVEHGRDRVMIVNQLVSGWHRRRIINNHGDPTNDKKSSMGISSLLWLETVHPWKLPGVTTKLTWEWTMLLDTLLIGLQLACRYCISLYPKWSQDIHSHVPRTAFLLRSPNCIVWRLTDLSVMTHLFCVHFPKQGTAHFLGCHNKLAVINGH